MVQSIVDRGQIHGSAVSPDQLSLGQIDLEGVAVIVDDGSTRGSMEEWADYHPVWNPNNDKKVKDLRGYPKPGPDGGVNDGNVGYGKVGLGPDNSYNRFKHEQLHKHSLQMRYLRAAQNHLWDNHGLYLPVFDWVDNNQKEVAQWHVERYLRDLGVEIPEHGIVGDIDGRVVPALDIYTLHDTIRLSWFLHERDPDNVRGIDYLINIDPEAVTNTKGVIGKMLALSQMFLYYSVQDGKRQGSGKEGHPSSLSGFRGSFHSITRFLLMQENLHLFRFQVGDLFTGLIINRAGFKIALSEHEIGLTQPITDYKDFAAQQGRWSFGFYLTVFEHFHGWYLKQIREMRWNAGQIAWNHAVHASLVGAALMIGGALFGMNSVGAVEGNFIDLVFKLPDIQTVMDEGVKIRFPFFDEDPIGVDHDVTECRRAVDVWTAENPNVNLPQDQLTRELNQCLLDSKVSSAVQAGQIAAFGIPLAIVGAIVFANIKALLRTDRARIDGKMRRSFYGSLVYPFVLLRGIMLYRIYRQAKALESLTNGESYIGSVAIERLRYRLNTYIIQ